MAAIQNKMMDMPPLQRAVQNSVKLQKTMKRQKFKSWVSQKSCVDEVISRKCISIPRQCAALWGI